MHLRLYGFTYNARSPCKQKNDKKKLKKQAIQDTFMKTS